MPGIVYGLAPYDGIYTFLYSLIFIPLFWFKLAQSTKRCHDLGESGWMQIIPFYFLILCFGKK